jgi:hypothetical protein
MRTFLSQLKFVLWMRTAIAPTAIALTLQPWVAGECSRLRQKQKKYKKNNSIRTTSPHTCTAYSIAVELRATPTRAKMLGYWFPQSLSLEKTAILTEDFKPGQKSLIMSFLATK